MDKETEKLLEEAKNNDILGFDLELFKNIQHENVFNYEEKPLYVYLAGKISSIKDWRGMIMGYYGRVCSAPDCIYDFNSTKETAKKYLQEKAVEEIPGIDNTYISGPFFISCDHRCFHGDSSHGLGLHKCGCPDGYGLVFEDYEVKEICLKQIERSDLVLAYIDSPDCYGTLHEIAYAQAIGKETIIVFANPKLRQDMWFCCADHAEFTKDECKYASVIKQKMGPWTNYKIYELLNRLGKDD